LRCLLTHGARAVLLTAQRQAAPPKPVTGLQPWAVELATRKGHDKTTIAVANKLARIVWAVWARDVSFEARAGRRVTSFSSVTKELLSENTTIIARQVGPALDEADNTIGPQRPLFIDWPRCAHVHDGQVRVRTVHRPDTTAVDHRRGFDGFVVLLRGLEESICGLLGGWRLP
jgi:hypothetical protein